MISDWAWDMGRGRGIYISLDQPSDVTSSEDTVMANAWITCSEAEGMSNWDLADI